MTIETAICTMTDLEHAHLATWTTKAVRAHPNNILQTAGLTTPEIKMPSIAAETEMTIVTGPRDRPRDEAGSRTETAIAKDISPRDTVTVEAAVPAEANPILAKRVEKS
jgi:hypothetical protein